jgi:hypothetical protein
MDEVIAMGQAEQLRQLYADFGRGDMGAVLAACSDSIVFHVPGRNKLAGGHDKGGFPAFIGQVMEMSAGTFREEIVDLMVGERYSAALLLHTLQKHGEPKEYLTIHLWEWDGEKFSNWWEHPRDQHVFDEIWS